jgi:glycine/D-amino acid oxidase-like deaminating enzyme
VSKHAVIIGAGVIGCAIGLQLVRKGYLTTNIDRQPEVGFGSTANSCAIVRFSYSTLAGVMLAHEGYHYWADWPRFVGVEDERGFARFIQCGHLMLRTSESDRAQVIAHYRQLGIPFETWSNGQIRARLPLLATHSFHPPRPVDDETFWSEPAGEIAGGIFTPQAGYIPDPQLATHNLRRAVEKAGGNFILRRTVTAIERGAGRVKAVVLDDGSRIPADVIVNVAGPHSALVNRIAGVEGDMSIKTRALRREVHHLGAPAGFDFGQRGVMVSDGDVGIYFRPGTGNSITLGSGDPPCDPKTWLDDPDECNREITDSQWNTQVYRLARRVPELTIPHRASGVVDMYDVADDWLPIYDRSSLAGFYMAIGTSGHQFKNAGAVGALMAELISACEQGLDHDRRPLQHRMPHSGRMLDAGAFSRLRAMDTKSSFSVRG